jgi:hypothetical protein
MVWTVSLDDDFASWLDGLDAGLRGEILSAAGLLFTYGPHLGRPKVDTVKGSEDDNMTELRVQYAGDPWRVLFAFDPVRNAVLLVGGNKAGDRDWYKRNIPIADSRYSKHLRKIRG